MLSQSEMAAKLTVVSVFSNIMKYKTDMTWMFGILEKTLSQSEMTAKLTFVSAFLAMSENTRLIPC